MWKVIELEELHNIRDYNPAYKQLQKYYDNYTHVIVLGYSVSNVQTNILFKYWEDANNDN